MKTTLKLTIESHNSVDIFSTGGGLFRRGVEFVEAGVYAGEYPQKLASDILWETAFSQTNNMLDHRNIIIGFTSLVT